MGVHTVRMPENLDKYVEIIINNGYASSYANALNLIVLERMMADKKAGGISAFRFGLKDNRKNETKLSEIETDNVTENIIRGNPEASEIQEDAPHLEEPTAPLKTPVTAGAGNDTTPERSERKDPTKQKGYGFRKDGQTKQSEFTGTEEELEKGLEGRTELKKFFKKGDQ